MFSTYKFYIFKCKFSNKNINNIKMSTSESLHLYIFLSLCVREHNARKI